jgi:arginyl-tRNA--protein-N-Asp/Glu arginylyltransferase
VDDAKAVGLIVAMILERPTCVRCISARIESTKLDTLRAMRRIVGAVPAEMRTGERCRVCGSTLAPVYVAARPG